MSRLRVIRWKLEAVLAALFLAAAIVTAVIPEWLEALGFEPDNGDGSAEWFIVGVLGLAAAATFVMSMVERRACTALAPSTKGLES